MKKCKECQYMEIVCTDEIFQTFRCYCRHPHQAYIRKFLKSKKSKKDPGLIGYTDENRGAPVKTSPMFCPYRRK